MLRASRASLAALLVTCAVLPARAQTNGFVLQCLSARASAQGCVTRGQANLPTSLFRDPAGIVAFDRMTLEVNAAPFMPALAFRNGANAGSDGALHMYPMFSAALVGPPLPNGLHWAVGMEPIGGFGSDFKLLHPLLSGTAGTPVDYESFFAAAKFGPTIAWEPVPGFSLGASASAVYGQIRDFRMPFTMDPSFAQGMAVIPQLDPAVYGPLFAQFTEMTAYGDSREYSGWTWTADLGIAYRARAGWSASASWSPERRIEMSGGVARLDMGAQFEQMLGAMVAARMAAYGEDAAAAQSAVMDQMTLAGLDLAAGLDATYAAATDLTLPMTAGAGARVPLGERWDVAAEVEWRRWSSAMETMPFRLRRGDNANLNMLINAEPANGDFMYPFPLDWRDTWTWKIGTEVALPRAVHLRGGYLHGANPVPATTVFVAFPAIATQAVSLGAGFELAGFPLDLSYVYAFESDLTGRAGHLMGSEYDGSHTDMSEHVFTIGTTVDF